MDGGKLWVDGRLPSRDLVVLSIVLGRRRERTVIRVCHNLHWLFKGCRTMNLILRTLQWSMAWWSKWRHWRIQAHLLHLNMCHTIRYTPLHWLGKQRKLIVLIIVQSRNDQATAYQSITRNCGDGQHKVLFISKAHTHRISWWMTRRRGVSLRHLGHDVDARRKSFLPRPQLITRELVHLR